jgi:Zn-dependent protease with chaperone function
MAYTIFSRESAGFPYLAFLYGLDSLEQVFGFAEYVDCRGGQISQEERELCTRLQQTLQTLTEQVRMRKRVELVCTKSFPYEAAAFGIERLPGRCKIVIGVSEAVKEHWTVAEGEFIVAHELSHIRNNDALSIRAIPLAVSAVTQVALAVLCPAATPLVFAFCDLISLVGSTVLLSRYQETRADLSAFSICSREGKEDAISVFEKMESTNQQRSFFGKARYFFTHELFHTSLSSRIASIKAMGKYE